MKSIQKKIKMTLQQKNNAMSFQKIEFILYNEYPSILEGYSIK